MKHHLAKRQVQAVRRPQPKREPVLMFQNTVISNRANAVRNETDAKWRVKFSSGLISADYLVLDLDPHYRWTVVGQPARNW
jgi:lipocalin